MQLQEAYEFAQWLEGQGKWAIGWRVLRIERTIGVGMREGWEWALLLSRPQTGDYAQVSDPYELTAFPHRLKLLPRMGREELPGLYDDWR